MKPTNTAFTSSPVTMLGTSRIAQQTREQVQDLSHRRECVLISGPQGSGKESLARCIHTASLRKDKPFVTLKCSLLSAGSLFDSQVFGHLPGAFAGLSTSSLGLIQSANGGTIFLREVECLELESQWKLFRTIQEQKVIPIGGSEGIPVDVRVIASTCIDLPLGVSVGMFRSDFYQLLSANLLETHRLADRMEDLPALAEEIVREVSSRRKLSPKRFGDSGWQWMNRYEWPGNLAELRKAIDLAVTTAPGEELDARSLRQAMKKVHARGVLFEQPLARSRYAGFSAMRSAGVRCRPSS